MILAGPFGRAMAWRRSCAAIVLALLAAACGNSGTTTTSPSAPTTTETFSGKLAAGSAAVHQFTVAQDGTAVLQLTSLSPQATITVGMGIGYPSTTAACLLVTQYETAAVGYTLSGTISPGLYCVAIYDVMGNVQGSVNYVLTLTHT